MSSVMQKDITVFIRTYPDQIRERIVHYHDLILQLYPEMQVTLDRPARMLAYGYGPRYKDFICSLILSQKGLKLGLNEGSKLPDPNGLLEGSGKLHKHLVLQKETDEKYITQLLHDAHQLYDERR